jgi:hypothetical protein
MMNAECKWEISGIAETDKEVHERGKKLVEEAFSALVKGSRTSPQDCGPCRAAIAIRCIVEVLLEKAEAYQ